MYRKAKKKLIKSKIPKEIQKAFNIILFKQIKILNQLRICWIHKMNKNKFYQKIRMINQKINRTNFLLKNKLTKKQTLFIINALKV